VVKRCAWANGDTLTMAYHDYEWGVPVHDDRLLFEFLVLEGAQSGLSWITILRKRENYRRAFNDFEPRKIASYDDGKVEELLLDPGIVRNRLKIKAAINNARALLEVQKEFGSFDAYIWQFVDGKPVQNRRQELSEIPAMTPDSKRMSSNLVRRGFSFAGPTVCYAFMQAIGMVNDHIVDCFRHDDLDCDNQKKTE